MRREYEYHTVDFSIDDLHCRLITDRGFNHKTVSTDSNLLHSHYYQEMFFVSSGKVDILFSDHAVTLSENDWICIAPDVLHNSVLHNETTLQTQRYVFAFTLASDNEKSSLLAEFRQIFQSVPYRILRGDERLSALYRRMISYYTDLSLKTDDRVRLLAACFPELLFYSKVMLGASGSGAAPTPVCADREYQQYLINAYINQHYMEDFNPEELGRLVYLSVQQVSRIVRRMTGHTLHRYVIFLRMQSAAKLLTETKLKVKDIAESVGYTSIHGFYAAFSNAYNTTPKNYRSNTKVLNKKRHEEAL